MEHQIATIELRQNLILLCWFVFVMMVKTNEILIFKIGNLFHIRLTFFIAVEEIVHLGAPQIRHKNVSAIILFLQSCVNVRFGNLIKQSNEQLKTRLNFIESSCIIQERVFIFELN